MFYRQKKTWWDCVKNDTESLGLFQKDAQSRNKWIRRITGATWIKLPLKRKCVRACLCVSFIDIRVDIGEVLLT